MRAGQSPRTYARAVYETALEGWVEGLQAVAEGLRQPGLLASLTDPTDSFAEKQRRLDPLIPSLAGQDLRNFLYLLLKENNIGFLDDIVSELQQMVRHGPQADRMARITTAIPLTDAERTAIQAKLRERFGHGLEFDFRINPEVLGGVVVRIGDLVIDDSVDGRLTTLHDRLLKAR
jgi:F-type H+-transporting ATPase subunit delta